VAPAVVLLLFALGAMLLGGRVIRGCWDEAPTWAGQLARAAAVGAGLSVVAIVAGLLRGSPGA
jgi:hypothetical protein